MSKTKYCIGCETEKSVEYFQSRVKRGKDVTRSRCRECENAYARKRGAELRKLAPEKVKAAKEAYYARNPQARMDEQYRRKAKQWGYDPQYVIDWVRKHGPECDSCGMVNGTLHLDHCHTTNTIRGMLCGNCNCGLGQFKDDIVRLKLVIDYLQKPQPFIQR